MSYPKKLFLSAIIGLVASILFLAVAFALSAVGIRFLFDFFLYASLPAASLLATILPASFVYWIAPDGGGVAAVALFLGGALIQQTVIVGGLAFFVFQRRSNSSLKVAPFGRWTPQNRGAL